MALDKDIREIVKSKLQDASSGTITEEKVIKLFMEAKRYGDLQGFTDIFTALHPAIAKETIDKAIGYFMNVERNAILNSSLLRGIRNKIDEGKFGDTIEKSAQEFNLECALVVRNGDGDRLRTYATKHLRDDVSFWGKIEAFWQGYFIFSPKQKSHIAMIMEKKYDACLYIGCYGKRNLRDVEVLADSYRQQGIWSKVGLISERSCFSCYKNREKIKP